MRGTKKRIYTISKPSAQCKHPVRRELFGILALLPVLIATGALSGCAGYTSAAAAGSGQATSAGSGVLSVSTNNVDFGNVDVGSSAIQAVTVTNTGSASVDIYGLAVSGTGFSVVSGNVSASLSVGQSGTIQVQFAPQVTGSASGDLTVTSDASSTVTSAIVSQVSDPELTNDASLKKTNFNIALHGNATQAGITISPTSLSFNNVTVGQSSAQSVTLTNTGTSNLHLKSATISGAGFAMSGLALPDTVAIGQSVSFSVDFAPTSSGAVTGTVAFSDNAPASPQTLSLAGSAVTPSGALTANPAIVSFNSVAVGKTSTQTITLTNSGSTTVTINQVAVTGSPFSASGISAGEAIAAGANASFTATFAPTTTGTASGTIALTTNASNSTLSIGLSGTGIQGALTANPSSINFGSVLVGSIGSATITLSNPGTAPVSISSASVTGSGFAVTGLPAQTLDPGSTSSFSVTFAPTSAGSATGTVSITSDAPGSPLQISLSGSATTTQAELTISPSSIAFDSVSVGSSSTQSVTLTNPGNAALNITAASITGSGYAMNLTAPATINPGASSNFTVTFAPVSAGTASGSVTITSNAQGSPEVLALSGTGAQAEISANPTSVSFGSVIVGSSNSQPITLQNGGNAPLTFSQVGVTGSGFSISGLSTATTIAAGSSLNFDAIFTPASANSASGSITLVTNASPSQLTIGLTGTGAAATYSLSSNPTTLNFGNVQVGNSSSLTTTVTNTGNSDITISSVTVSGTGYSASGINSGLILGPSQTATLTATFAPTASGNSTGSLSIASDATSTTTTVSLSGESHTVLLSWTASTSTDVTGYYVYRGTQAGQYTELNPTAPVSGTKYTDTSAKAGTTYYYVVTAVDTNNVESGYSNSATASIP